MVHFNAKSVTSSFQEVLQLQGKEIYDITEFSLLAHESHFLMHSWEIMNKRD